MNTAITTRALRPRLRLLGAALLAAATALPAAPAALAQSCGQDAV